MSNEMLLETLKRTSAKATEELKVHKELVERHRDLLEMLHKYYYEKVRKGDVEYRYSYKPLSITKDKITMLVSLHTCNNYFNIYVQEISIKDTLRLTEISKDKYYGKHEYTYDKLVDYIADTIPNNYRTEETIFDNFNKQFYQFLR